MRLGWVPLGLALALLLGCGNSSGGHASSSKPSSSGQGKTFAPAKKGTAKGAQSKNESGSGESGVLPMPAQTANGRASAASDEGTMQATQGQVVVTPGAPVAKGKAGKH